MILLFDCDGVALDFSRHLLKTVGSTKTLRAVKDWNIKSVLTPQQKKRMDRVLNHKSGEFWRTQPLIPGAKKGIREIRKFFGCDPIHWVTSPWYSCPVWESIRREMLLKHFGSRYDDITFGYKKWMISGDIFIDDKPEHVEKWREWRAWDKGAGLLFDAPYNRGATHLDDVRVTWKTLPDTIRKLTRKHTQKIMENL